MKKFLSGPLAVLLSLSCSPAASPEAADYAGSDGRMTFDEFFLYQVKARDPKLSQIDTNGDFTVDAQEKEAFAGLDWNQVRATKGQTTISVETARSTVPPPPPDGWSPQWLRLRKDHESIVKELEDADPASIGFYSNNLNNEDTWTAEAALGVVLPLIDRKIPPTIGNYYLEEMNLISSASLNRVTGTGDGSLDVTDSLAFRGGLSAYLQARHSNAWWDYQIVSLNYRAEGSTQGGTYKSAGELDWVPMRFGRKDEIISLNGPFHPLFGNEDTPLLLRWDFSGHLEFGEDQSGSDFAKVGPKVGISVKPTFLPGVSFFANYNYLWETMDGQRDLDYLETGGRWQIDKSGQVFLEAKYRVGQLPAQYTDIDVFQVSLAFKF